MQKGDKFIIVLFIIAMVFVFLAYINQKKYEPRSTSPIIETIHVENPHIETCGQLSGCEKGA